MAFVAPLRSFSDPAPSDGPRRGRRPRVSLDELARLAADRAMALAERPDLQIAPSRVGLTGLDSYVWLARVPNPVVARATALGTTVTAEAHPVQYQWSFGDGHETTTSHPGRRWTKHRPGNISHVYETRGRYEVVVRVIWEARWRVDDGPWMALGFFSNSDTRPYPVRQVVAVLTKD